MYFISRNGNTALNVTMNENGTLTMRDKRGNLYKDAGLLITSCGGVDAFLAKCKDGDLGEAFEARRAEAKRLREHAAAIEAEKAAKAETAYKAMVAAGEPVEATRKNIAILLRYLATANWGTWSLPEMTIGYRCNQYDCAGTIAAP